jgi:hypothetical protein
MDIKVSINDKFIVSVADESEDWVRNRWKMVQLPIVQKELEGLNLTRLHFHPEECWLNIVAK